VTTGDRLLIVARTLTVSLLVAGCSGAKSGATSTTLLTAEIEQYASTPPSAPAHPPSRTTPGVDCYSGNRTLTASSYAFEAAATPEGVVAFPLEGAPTLVAAEDSQVWVNLDIEGYLDRLIHVDSDTGEVIHSVDIEPFVSLEIDGGTPWIAQIFNDAVLKFDSKARQLARVQLPRLEPGFLRSDGSLDQCFLPSAISLGEEGLWVLTARRAIARVDPDLHELVALVRPPEGQGGKLGLIVGGLGRMWITSNGQSLWHVDPNTNTWSGEVRFSQTTGHYADQMAVANGSLWVSGGSRKDQGPGLSRVDQLDFSLARTASFGKPVLLASDTDQVLAAWEPGVGPWIINDDGSLPRQPFLCSEAEPFALAVDDDMLWVSLPGARTLWRIDLNETPGCQEVVP
jgi:streptogramin lyase